MTEPLHPIGYGPTSSKRRTNAPAVASLVFGILGCVPFLTGILAIVFGVAGIRKSRDPSIEGKGLAVAGLILGIISVVAWSAGSVFFGYAYSESKPAGLVAQQFLKDVSAGKIKAASANSVGITPAQLQGYSDQIKPFGALQSVSISSFNFSAINGKTTVHLAGTAAFTTGARGCTFDLVKVNDGTYKVTSSFVQ